MLNVQTRRPRQREFLGSQPGNVGYVERGRAGLPPDYIVQQSRKETENLEFYEAQARDYRQIDIRGNWEQKTDKQIRKTMAWQRFNAEKQRQSAALEQRRDKLRQLLIREEREQMALIEASYETPLERQAALRQKSRLLREEKAKDQKSFVDEKYEQQWRNQCEPLRTAISKQNAYDIKLDNLKDLERKQADWRIQQQEEQWWADLNKKEYEKKVERENDDLEKQRERTRQTLEVVKQQKAQVAEKIKLEQELKEEERKLRDAMTNQMNLEANIAHEDKLRAQKEMRQLLDTNIRQKAKIRNKELQEELAFDLKILDELLKASETEAEMDAIRKKQLNEESRRYQAYLIDLKELEKQREKELDLILESEVKKQWERRIEQWRRERQARKALMEDVLRGRREQIEYKLSQNALAQQEAVRDREALQTLIAENKEKDRIELENAHKKRVLYDEDLCGQIQFNERLRQRDISEKHREEQKMAEFERQYVARVQQTLSANNLTNPKVHPWRRHYADTIEELRHGNQRQCSGTAGSAAVRH